MAIGATSRVLRVFVASPGDLIEERAEIKRGVDYSNKLFERSLRWRIQLYGWEDTLPTFGRPQDRINRKVDECDLFIGMLWKRWGEPTAGGYSSGFEEGFTRAVERRKKTGAPEIWLFFKDIEPAQLNDPGEQLQRVIAFRKRERDAKQLLYKEFQDLAAFRELIREVLPEYLLQLSTGADAVASPSQAPTVVTHAGSNDAASTPRSAHPYSGEITTLAQTLKNLANGKLRGNLSREEIDPRDAARLYLVGKSVVSSAYTQATAGVHEINLAYKYTNNAVLSPAEKNLIFRSLTADDHDTMPGWLWFRTVKRETLLAILQYFVRYDSTDEVRTGALAALKGTKLRLGQTRKEFGDYVVALIKDDAVRRQALEYFIAVARPRDIQLLNTVLVDPKSPIFGEVQRAIRFVLYRTNPAKGFRAVLRQTRIDDAELDKVRTIISDISATLLRTALAHPDAGIRQLAGNELLSRDLLSNEQATIMINDENAKVREVGLLEQARSGKRLDLDALRQKERARFSSLSSDAQVDLTNVAREYFEHLDKDSLVTHVTWTSIDGPTAYEILGDRFFEERAATIRHHLKTQFAELKAAALAAFQQTYPLLGPITDPWPLSVDQFIRDGFIAGALRLLAKRGGPSDLPLARRFIPANDLRVVAAALAVLEHFGTSDDLEALLQLAVTSTGELKLRAADTAMRLSPGVTGAAETLIKSGDIPCILAACRHLKDATFKGLEPLLSPLAERREPGMRLIFTWFMANSATRRQRIDFLRTYVGRNCVLLQRCMLAR